MPIVAIFPLPIWFNKKYARLQYNCYKELLIMAVRIRPYNYCTVIQNDQKPCKNQWIVILIWNLYKLIASTYRSVSRSTQWLIFLEIFSPDKYSIQADQKVKNKNTRNTCCRNTPQYLTLEREITSMLSIFDSLGVVGWTKSCYLYLKKHAVHLQSQ